MAAKQFAFTFTEKDLFRGYNVEVIRDRVVQRKKKSRKELCSKIFADTFFEILLDIIQIILPLWYLWDMVNIQKYVCNLSKVINLKRCIKKEVSKM